MKLFSGITFPLAVVAATVALSSSPVRERPDRVCAPVIAADTVIYPSDAYKIGRTGEMPDEKLPDSVLVAAGINVFIPSADSLDSLDTLEVMTPEELAKRIADSTLRAQIHYKDSIRQSRLDEKDRRDSIRESIPRVLETFALPETLQFKRIIHWTVDQDFHNLEVSQPDTSFNYHYHDYPFLRRDVNATWLGMAGSPVQTYNYFLRDIADEGVEFYRVQESWAYSPSTMLQYNSKTPHTELAYYGTLLGGTQKESDNVHILTTQNILPAWNVTFMFDLFGGAGMLANEKTRNSNVGIGTNYLGKKYMMNFGCIHNKVPRGENGGMTDLSEGRDTTIDAREMKVYNTSASSEIKKMTFFLDQQFRIPFEFLKRKGSADSTMVVDSTELAEETKVDTVTRDITSAFIGHSFEYSQYGRKYTDTGIDSMGVHRLDNKVFIRLQPWSSEGIVSKIDFGVGDRLMNYTYGPKLDTAGYRNATENSIYMYAGVQGQYRKYLNWSANAHYCFAGYRSGDFDIGGKVNFNFFPFRRDRSSPVSLTATAKTSLIQPSFFQEHFYSHTLSWDNDFKKASQTKIEGILDIPRWKMDLRVGYALLSGNTYYDTLGVIRQNVQPMSVLSGSLRKEFVIGNIVHLDNRILAQLSSNPEVLPLPLLSFNLRYFAQFVVARTRDEARTPALTMQVGVDAYYNTAWNSPSWNPVTGTFHNQNKEKFNNGPFFDVFVNMQWKRACIFVKLENAGQGWPVRPYDYFSANGYIVSQRAIKFGIFWPFYTQPNPAKKVNIESAKK
ncbi:MAG: putative porin [Bacteroidales bacterium]|nr:putative porin [Bacteroidales bacterium]